MENDAFEGTGDGYVDDIDEWHDYDEQFDVHVPDSNRVLLPPSTEVQGRLDGWNMEARAHIPDLKGKSLEQGQRLHATFSSHLVDFDFAQSLFTVLPCLLNNDLDSNDICSPPEVAIKKGRHRVVRLQGGASSRSNQPLADDEYIDQAGQLFVLYPIEDEPHLLDPLPTSGTTPVEAPAIPPARKWKPSSVRSTRQIKCSYCALLGHNVRTCKARATGSTVEPANGQARAGAVANARIDEHVEGDGVDILTNTQDAPSYGRCAESEASDNEDNSSGSDMEDRDYDHGGLENTGEMHELDAHYYEMLNCSGGWADGNGPDC